MGEELYDTIGVSYGATRRPDPRIASAIHVALGDAETVVNVGAGAGSYEPSDRRVVAVEPSPVMAHQRPPGGAPVVRGRAEALPFADNEFQAAMAVLTDHHWTDWHAGLRELRRVARRRVVLFNADPALAGTFWLTHHYLPEFIELIPEPYRRPGHWAAELARVLGGDVRLEPVPIPHDCSDGFYGAFWRRPRAYLDGGVRDGISVFAALPRDVVAVALGRLERDLDAGAWRDRHGDLLGLDALDLGYRVVIAELDG